MRGEVVEYRHQAPTRQVLYNAAPRFRAHSPWKSDAAKPSSILDAGKPGTATLAPFEVLTLELTPMAAGS